MDKEYLKGVYNYLNEQGDNYYLAVKKSQKADIEDRIQQKTLKSFLHEREIGFRMKKIIISQS